ncbi:MAG: DNA-processing protein DprA [Xanthomonadales bacterium]|nr:DNA-processing protein DprA [Xanthomonadales bacterium]
MLDSYQAWLLLTRCPGLGSSRILKLINHFGNAEAVFSQKTLPTEFKIPAKSLDWVKHPDLESIQPDLEWLEKEHNHIITIDDDLYPTLLKKAESPPPVLFVTGKPEVLFQPQIAVVGSRNASQVGLENTRSFCYDLASKGLTITSGLAIGVDGTAHKAALQAGGTTIAVTGTGLDVVYPSQNRELAHEIAKTGALVSEFPIGTKPHAKNFPRRNRIICGLSLGTLVIEAGIQSGTLITARQTMEINRPVMAIPGSIHNPNAKGCNYLIKQGAKLVESAPEIVEELTPLAHSLSFQIKEKLELLKNKTVQTENKPYINAGENENNELLSHIMYEPTAIDDIIINSGLTAREVASTLLILELEDKIRALPGAQYIRI